MASFGERLRELRAAHGLSQEAVANRLGVSAQAVSKWEKGKSLPDLSVILPLAELFRVSTDELLGNDPPAGKWEAEWHRSIRAGDPAQAVVTALQALEQFPGDTRFLCRLAEAEYLAGFRAETEEDKRRFLEAAERHYRALLRQFPDYEEAKSRLALTLYGLGRTREAELLARGLKRDDETLLHILRGEARERQLRLMTARRALDFYDILLRRPSHERADLAEKLLEDFPWDPRDRLSLLARLCYSRARLFCREGKTEEAMASLYRVKDLARQWETLPEKAESPVFGRATGPSAGADWFAGYSLLHDPQLKPLFDREEYRELVRLRDQYYHALGFIVVKEE